MILDFSLMDLMTLKLNDIRLEFNVLYGPWLDGLGLKLNGLSGP